METFLGHVDATNITYGVNASSKFLKLLPNYSSWEENNVKGSLHI